jgi:hypothetical protein
MIGVASEKHQESLSNLGVEQSSNRKSQNKHENEQSIQPCFQSKKQRNLQISQEGAPALLLMCMFVQTGCRTNLSILRRLGQNRLDHVGELVQKLGDHVHVVFNLFLDRVTSSGGTSVGNRCNVGDDGSSLDRSRGRSLGTSGHCRSGGRRRVGRRGLRSGDVLHRCNAGRRRRGRWRLGYRGGDLFLIIIVLPFFAIFVIVFALVTTVLDGGRGRSRRWCRDRGGGRGRRWGRSNWAR